jgi:response regulator RpfG family c-di-GMP phosphodiesterase
MLERALRNDFDVLCASSGAEGLDLLAIHDVALIISDQRMPSMTGVDFLKRSAELRPHCVRVILTGYTDAGSLVDALNSGVVYKYITKPWVKADLFQTVTRGLAHHETIKAQHRLKLENERLRDRIQADDACFIRLCGELQQVKVQEARQRASRVRELAEATGRHLKLDPVALDQLSSAAYLHRVADIDLPDALLDEDRTLTDDEHSIKRSARQRVYSLLADIPGFEPIADLVRHQYEYFDGSLSPEGLRGEQIPLGARIVSVVKAFDRMTSPAFSQTSTESEALAFLHGESGARFDPAVVAAFCAVRNGVAADKVVSEFSMA